MGEPAPDEEAGDFVGELLSPSAYRAATDLVDEAAKAARAALPALTLPDPPLKPNPGEKPPEPPKEPPPNEPPPERTKEPPRHEKLPDPEPPPDRGLTFVPENWGKVDTPARQAALDFDAATEGAASDIATRQRWVPALRYTNRNPKGARYVKFDGWRRLDDGRIELIDAKRRIVPYANKSGPRITKKVSGALKRQSQALEQNPGYVGVLELPSEAAAQEAREVIKSLGIDNIVVRVRQP